LYQVDQKHNSKLITFSICLLIFYLEYLWFNQYSGIWPELVQARLNLKLISIRHIFIFLPIYIFVLILFKHKSHTINLIPKLNNTFEISLCFLASHLIFLFLLDWLLQFSQTYYMNIWLFIFAIIILMIAIVWSCLSIFYVRVAASFYHLFSTNKFIILYSSSMIFLTLVIDLSYAEISKSSYIESQLLHLPKNITFELVSTFLNMFFDNATMNINDLSIGTDNFLIYIGHPCSGSVGINLFLLMAGVIYFSEHSRYSTSKFGFLILISFGFMLSFIGNALRIFLLIVIGDLGYGEIALQGFHSSAGIFFFLALISCFLYCYALINTKKPPSLAFKHKHFLEVNDVYPYVFPFMVWLLLGILSRVFYFYWDWGYAIRVVLFFYIIWLFKDWAKKNLKLSNYFIAVIAGLEIGLIWLYFMQENQVDNNFHYFLSSHSLVISSWLILKVIGFIVIVPVVEELFFRGFLSRALIRFEFKSIPLGQFSFYSFIGSAIAFSLLHQNYYLAFFVACILNYILMKTKSLGAVILCHAIANATICVYIIYFNRWDIWM